MVDSSESGLIYENDRALRRARKVARERFWSRFDRESYECESCSRDDVLLEVHHIDGDPFHNQMYNLAALCHRCHRICHKREVVTARVQQMREDFSKLTA